MSEDCSRQRSTLQKAGGAKLSTSNRVRPLLTCIARSAWSSVCTLLKSTQLG